MDSVLNLVLVTWYNIKVNDFIIDNITRATLGGKLTLYFIIAYFITDTIKLQRTPHSVNSLEMKDFDDKYSQLFMIFTISNEDTFILNFIFISFYVQL